MSLLLVRTMSRKVREILDVNLIGEDDEQGGQINIGCHSFQTGQPSIFSFLSQAWGINYKSLVLFKLAVLILGCLPIPPYYLTAPATPGLFYKQLRD